MNTTWDAPTRRTVAIILGVLLVYIIYLARPVLPFLIIAGLIAFILAPIISFLHRKLRFPKGLAILTAYVLLLVALVLIPITVVPAAVSAFAAIKFDPIEAARLIQQWIIATLNAYRQFLFFGFEVDLSTVVDTALEYVRDFSPNSVIPSFDSIISYIPTTVQLTWGVAASLFGTLASAFAAILLTVLYSIYMSAGASSMRASFFRMVPEAYRPEIAILSGRIQNVWSAYLRGQLTLGVIIWLLTWIFGEMIGLPGAFGLGVIAGALEILPNLGPILAAIPALLVALIQGSTYLDVSNFTFFLIVLGVYVLIQQLENNLIVPKVLGNAVELSPLAVMVGVVVGFSVGGILGALVAAPLIATAREIVFYAYAKVLMQEPFPPKKPKVEPQPSFPERLRQLRQATLARWQRLSQLRQTSKKDN